MDEQKMKNGFFAVCLLMLAACSTQEIAGTAVINGRAADMYVTPYASGTFGLDGWELFINGERIGVFEFDGRATRGNSQHIQQFKSIQSRYGEFDAEQTINLVLTGSTNTFRITLDGEFVGTVSGRLQ
jgi:hypothetical protein